MNMTNELISEAFDKVLNEASLNDVGGLTALRIRKEIENSIKEILKERDELLRKRFMGKVVLGAVLYGLSYLNKAFSESKYVLGGGGGMDRYGELALQPYLADSVGRNYAYKLADAVMKIDEDAIIDSVLGESENRDVAGSVAESGSGSARKPVAESGSLPE